MQNDFVSEIQIIPIKPQNGLIAFCSFVIFESIYCSSVAIFTRPAGGYRLVYPTKKYAGKDMNIFHPIGKVAGTLIEQEVMKQLKNVIHHDRHNSSEI